jgi:hypothetical protein
MRRRKIHPSIRELLPMNFGDFPKMQIFVCDILRERIMDRLRKMFSPKYNYREGDEFHLPPDELLRFAKEETEDMNVTVFYNKEN